MQRCLGGVEKVGLALALCVCLCACQTQSQGRTRAGAVKPEQVNPQPAQQTAPKQASGVNAPEGPRPVQVDQPAATPVVLRAPDAGAVVVDKPACTDCGGKRHVVKRGDTLMGIARSHYGQANAHRWRDILAANPSVTDPGRLLVGQELLIPE